MIIKIEVKATVNDRLYGFVPDDIWEQYQSGEIDDWDLYCNFEQDDSYNLDYEVTDFKEIREW